MSVHGHRSGFVLSSLAHSLFVGHIERISSVDISFYLELVSGHGRYFVFV
jgi:hypothetical protein